MLHDVKNLSKFLRIAFVALLQNRRSLQIAFYPSFCEALQRNFQDVGEQDPKLGQTVRPLILHIQHRLEDPPSDNPPPRHNNLSSPNVHKDPVQINGIEFRNWEIILIIIKIGVKIILFRIVSDRSSSWCQICYQLLDFDWAGEAYGGDEGSAWNAGEGCPGEEG